LWRSISSTARGNSRSRQQTKMIGVIFAMYRFSDAGTKYRPAGDRCLRLARSACCIVEIATGLLHDDRRIEVVAQAGAEDMLTHLGAAGCSDNGGAWDRDRKDTGLGTEIDIEIFGFRGPILAQHSRHERERGFDTATHGPAASGVGDFNITRRAE